MENFGEGLRAMERWGVGVFNRELCELGEFSWEGEGGEGTRKAECGRGRAER